MKNRFYKGLLLGALLLAAIPSTVHAQGFSVPWFVVAGGGGTATNGAISISGTFGQWDANEQALTNGLFSLSGGFWGYLEGITPSSTSTSAPPIITNSGIIVTITAPANDSSTVMSNITVKGTVKGSGADDQLEITVGTNAPVVVTGTSSKGIISWTTTVLLAPGANLITAQTVNTNTTELANTNILEIVSVPAARTVFYITTPPVTADKSVLTLSVSPVGKGKISGEANGAKLELNKVFTVKATPIANWIFADWTLGTNTNSILGYSPSLSFIMTSNLALQANFVTNPFTAVVGAYNGLFAPDSGASEETSGFLTATLAAKSVGAFSAKMLLDGDTYSFSGTFNPSGDAQVTVPRTGKQPVQVVLHLNLDLPTPDDQMSGFVINFATNTGWSSTLLADRSVFSTKSNPATNFVGKYTLIIPPGSGSPTNSPGGYSYATLANTSTGVVALSGSLADKSTISQSVPVSKYGNVPLYVSLYSHKGSLQGWLTLTNQTTNQLVPVQMIVATNLAWFKPVVPKSLYAAGFSNTDLAALGSLYKPPFLKADALTNFTNGTLTISNGDLPEALVYTNLTFTDNKLATNGAAPGNPTNLLSGVITPTTGLLTVTFRPTGEKANITAKGVVLQDSAETNAAGWFAGATNSGYFLLQP